MALIFFLAQVVESAIIVSECKIAIEVLVNKGGPQ